jgi:hypothetical protein
VTAPPWVDLDAAVGDDAATDENAVLLQGVPAGRAELVGRSVDP